jgi:transcriptional regulator with XRE-family HTH domain
VSSYHTTPIFLGMATLGTSIREWRTERGLQQGELASKAGIPQAALSDIERGKTKLPSADIRRRIAKALGVSHLRLLIASGEITEDELGDKVGTVERDDDDPRERLIARIRDLPENVNTRALELAVILTEEQLGK